MYSAASSKNYHQYQYYQQSANQSQWILSRQLTSSILHFRAIHLACQRAHFDSPHAHTSAHTLPERVASYLSKSANAHVCVCIFGHTKSHAVVYL